MQIEIVPRPGSNTINESYMPISTMPDMDAGEPVNISVQLPQDVSNYEPDITVIAAEYITEVISVKRGRKMVRANAVSAYPAELVNKYQMPKFNGNFVISRCKQCNIIWSPSGLDDNGICLYCITGMNGYTNPITI